MITVTLTINGVPTKKQLPTRWDDVTWQQFVDLNEIGFDRPYEQTKYFLGVKNNIIFNTADANVILQVLNFLNYPEQMLTKPVSSKVNIGNESWANLEKAKSALNAAQGDMLKCGASIANIYTDEDITARPVTEALPLVGFFLTSWKSFLKIMRNSRSRMRRFLKN
jgi:hypothetical protein